MATSDQSELDEAIESEILAILDAHPKLTFTSLAEAVPEYRWAELFRALNRLRERQQVELSTLPWDYEVVLRSSGACHRKG